MTNRLKTLIALIMTLAILGGIPCAAYSGVIDTDNGELCFAGSDYTGGLENDRFSSRISAENAPGVNYGIDVSSWQGTIDFKKVKNAGIDFVIIRAGYSGTKDKNFETNYAGAKAGLFG